MKTRIFLPMITSIFAALLITQGAHVATHTYDLAADFSGVENPNCVWSYGWSQSRGSTFNLATTPGQDSSNGTVIGWELFGGIIPAYAVTDYYSNSTAFVPQGTVNLHPGPSGALCGGLLLPQEHVISRGHSRAMISHTRRVPMSLSCTGGPRYSPEKSTATMCR